MHVHSDSIIFLCLQCHCTIPYSETDHTLHILSHYCGHDKQKTPDKFRQYLQKFSDEHKDWIASVSSRIFKHKGITVEQYITVLLQPNFVLDQVGIFIFARMYHMHIAIVFNDRFLYTSRDNDLQKCEIFLGYFSKMRFLDTRPIKWDPQTLDSLLESDESFEILPVPRRNQESQNLQKIPVQQ